MPNSSKHAWFRQSTCSVHVRQHNAGSKIPRDNGKIFSPRLFTKRELLWQVTYAQGCGSGCTKLPLLPSLVSIPILCPLSCDDQKAPNSSPLIAAHAAEQRSWSIWRERKGNNTDKILQSHCVSQFTSFTWQTKGRKEWGLLAIADVKAADVAAPQASSGRALVVYERVGVYGGRVR